MVTFHQQFAEILGEGLPYTVFEDWGGPNSWMIRCYRPPQPGDPEGSTGDTLRTIAYQIEGDELIINSLSTERGGGQILRIAAAAADLFAEQGFTVVKGRDFGATGAGQAFKDVVAQVGGTEEGDLTALPVEDFQELKTIKADKDAAKNSVE